MANYENIRPYAEFSHTAAMNGGVDNYLNSIAQDSYSLGVMNGECIAYTNSAIAGGIMLAITACGMLYRRYKQKYIVDERDEMIQRIKQEMEEVPVPNMPIDDIMDDLGMRLK